MSVSDNSFTEAIALLSNKQSAKRRSGAKLLRKLKNPNSGPPLLAALKKEVQDIRTWETQYQLIMALGESTYIPALPYLHELSLRHFEATMLYIALGDALVRLDLKNQNDSNLLFALIQTRNDFLIEGAFRAVAMLHLPFNTDIVTKIITFANERGPVFRARFWIAAAAAEWEGANVRQFLLECSIDGGGDLKKVALASLNKKHLSFHPL